MSDVTVFTDVRVFDGSRLSEPTAVVVEHGLISAGTAPPPGTEVVDGAGAALLPGLIDTHAHIGRRSQLEAAGRWGVTTVLDMGTPTFDATMALRHQPGLPTLQTAGRPASGAGSMFITQMGHPASSAVTGPDDADRWVADRVAEQSDYVKILVEDPKFPGTKPLPADSIAAVVASAHRAGLLTIAHVVSADTMRTAIGAGVDVVTHTTLTGALGPEIEAALAGRDVVIVPTLVMMDGVATAIGGKPLMRVLAVFVSAVRMKYSWAEETVRTFHRAGRTVLVGTDSNDNPKAPFQVPYGESVHDELERLVRAGLTPVEALQGATAHAARVFGLADRGSIAPGLRADLLLVAGDPTVDITATRDIRGVWIGGRRTR